MSASGPPAGYRQSAIGGTMLVVRDDLHDAVRSALGSGTLHGWAATQPGARAMQGRGVAWATRLAGHVEVVVRHSRHGGALAGLTGDLFLAPTRAPRELEATLRLQAAGVPTPGVIAYAVYRAFGPLCRADVVTTLVRGDDLPAAWAAAHSPAARDGIVDAVATLLRALRAAGAHHPDLNVKNVLISVAGDAPLAWALDVDRVIFGAAGNAAMAERNARRLGESVAKWRTLHGLDIGKADWHRLLDGAGIAGPARSAGAE